MNVRWVTLLLAPLLSGCVLPDLPSPPPVPEPLVAEVTAFSLSEACVARYDAFVATVTLRNPEARVGRAEVVVHARQFGNIARTTVDLAPHEERTLNLPVTIDFAGRWEVYVTGASSLVEQTTIRVVDSVAGGRC